MKKFKETWLGYRLTSKYYWEMKWNNVQRIPDCLWNFWRFRKEVYNFQPWDYRYNLDLFRASLSKTADYIEKHDRYVRAQDDVKDIKMFLKCTDKREFWDVCEEYNDYISNSEMYFEDTGKGDNTSYMKFKNNSSIIEDRKNQLTKRAIAWEQARWNRAWSLVKNNMQGWWD